MTNPYEKLAQLGLSLPADPGPGGTYVPARRCGDVVYLAGQCPRHPDGGWIVGRVGENIDVETAYAHARAVALQLLSVADGIAGGLDKIEVLKVFGMVNAVPHFQEHPKVINGCSDLLVEILGENGRHARSAVGMGSLPNGVTVEIEAIIRIIER